MEHFPAAFLQEPSEGVINPLPKLLILNQPIANFAIFKRLWQRTDYRLCADGGANRLYDMLSGEADDQESKHVKKLMTVTLRRG